MNLLYLGLSNRRPRGDCFSRDKSANYRRPSTGDDAATTGRLRMVAWVVGGPFKFITPLGYGGPFGLSGDLSDCQGTLRVVGALLLVVGALLRVIGSPFGLSGAFQIVGGPFGLSGAPSGCRGPF